MDGSAWNDPPPLSQEKAEECLALVRERVSKTEPEWAEYFTLHEPGFHAKGWTIALEGWSYDWPWHLTQDDTVTWPAGVFAEPVSSWCLGLYPA